MYCALHGMRLTRAAHHPQTEPPATFRSLQILREPHDRPVLTWLFRSNGASCFGQTVPL